MDVFLSLRESIWSGGNLDRKVFEKSLREKTRGVHKDRWKSVIDEHVVRYGKVDGIGESLDCACQTNGSVAIKIDFNDVIN